MVDYKYFETDYKIIKKLFNEQIKFQRGCSCVNLLAKISERIAISFIKIFKDGPDVSLRGSPTVSPTTAAL